MSSGDGHGADSPCRGAIEDQGVAGAAAGAGAAATGLPLRASSSSTWDCTYGGSWWSGSSALSRWYAASAWFSWLAWCIASEYRLRRGGHSSKVQRWPHEAILSHFAEEVETHDRLQ